MPDESERLNLEDLAIPRIGACKYDAPSRVWFETQNGWASREWLPGEKDTYRCEVLGW